MLNMQEFFVGGGGGGGVHLHPSLPHLSSISKGKETISSSISCNTKRRGKIYHLCNNRNKCVILVVRIKTMKVSSKTNITIKVS